MASGKRTRRIDPRQARLLLEEPNLAEALAYYDATYLESAKEGTRRTYRCAFRFWLARLPEFPTAADVDQAVAAELRRYEQSARREGCGRETLRLRKKILGAVLERCRLHWRLMPNFIAESTPVRGEPPRPRGLADPLGTFPELLRVMPDARARVFLRLQREHGLRIGEVLGLEAADVNWERGEVRVQRQRDPEHLEPKPLKSDTSAATIPVSASLLAELREAIRADMRAPPPSTGARQRYLFPYYRTTLEEFIALCRVVAPDDFPEGDAWHVLRHTFGTEAVDVYGLRVEKVQSLMRHKNIRTTQGYIGSIRGGYFDADAMRDLTAKREAAQAARTLTLNPTTASSTRETSSRAGITGSSRPGGKRQVR